MLALLAMVRVEGDEEFEEELEENEVRGYVPEAASAARDQRRLALEAPSRSQIGRHRAGGCHRSLPAN